MTLKGLDVPRIPSTALEDFVFRDIDQFLKSSDNIIVGTIKTARNDGNGFTS